MGEDADDRPVVEGLVGHGAAGGVGGVGGGGEEEGVVGAGGGEAFVEGEEYGDPEAVPEAGGVWLGVAVGGVEGAGGAPTGGAAVHLVGVVDAGDGGV